MEIIRRRLKRVLKRKRGVKSTIISHENAKPEDPQIEKYREAIFERFGKTVLTAEIIPDGQLEVHMVTHTSHSRNTLYLSAKSPSKCMASARKHIGESPKFD